jgi:hypothetical protein
MMEFIETERVQKGRGNKHVSSSKIPEPLSRTVYIALHLNIYVVLLTTNPSNQVGDGECILST